jgi:hypothetical protein
MLVLGVCAQMKLRRLRAAVIALAGVTAAAQACAPVSRPGARVDIADESAIIIWDAASHTQHFIRRATFATPVRDFGFLVPTPSRPTLAEAPDAAFDQLAKITSPRVIKKVVYEPGTLGCAARAPLAANVHVLELTHVAGYDAAVLAADDPAGLNHWLGEHGYESRPALTGWLAPYIKAGWTVTAFKIAKTATADSSVSTAAVRMTFQTDRPFFPYREPEDQRDATANSPPRRLLRVYFVGQGRFTGTRDGGSAWPGATAWADALPQERLAELVAKLGVVAPKGGSLWLTEFEDHSSPRPGTDDVYFTLSADQTPAERSPQVYKEYSALPDLICIGFIGLFIVSIIVLTIRKLALVINWLVPPAR